MTRRGVSRDGYTCLDIPSNSCILRTCLVCHKIKPPGQPGPYKHCAKCRTRVYCSISCQKKDWIFNGHKENCSIFVENEEAIRQSRLQMEQTAAAVGQDVWDPNGDIYGNFFSNPISKTYFIQRCERTISVKDTNLLDPLSGWILLENSLDILDFERRCSAPEVITGVDNGILLGLGKIQDHQKGYSVCKGLAQRGCYSQFNPPTSKSCTIGTDGAPGLNEDLSESTEALDLAHFYMHKDALMGIYHSKFWVFLATKTLQYFNRRVLKNEDCTSLIAEFCGMRGYWWRVPDANMYHLQAREILTALYKHDRHYLQFTSTQIRSRNSPAADYLRYFLRHAKTEMVSLPVDRKIEARRLDHILKIGDDTFRDTLEVLGLKDTGPFNSEYAKKALKNLSLARLKRTSPTQNIRPIEYFELFMEMEVARAYFHRHKYSDPVRALFAQMNKDCTQITPKFFKADPFSDIFLNTEVRQIIKLLDRYSLRSDDNLDLLFGIASRVDLYWATDVTYVRS
jgi:hypothetical protein